MLTRLLLWQDAGDGKGWRLKPCLEAAPTASANHWPPGACGHEVGSRRLPALLRPPPTRWPGFLAERPWRRINSPHSFAALNHLQLAGMHINHQRVYWNTARQIGAGANGACRAGGVLAHILEGAQPAQQLIALFREVVGVHAQRLHGGGQARQIAMRQAAVGMPNHCYL